MPYPTPVKQRDGSAMIYDSGDYPEVQRRALKAAEWNEFPTRQEKARREGRYIGIGLVVILSKARGAVPSKARLCASHAREKTFIATGATAQGQGVKTMLSQITGGVQLGISCPKTLTSPTATPPHPRVASAPLPAASR